MKQRNNLSRRSFIGAGVAASCIGVGVRASDGQEAIYANQASSRIIQILQDLYREQEARIMIEIVGLKFLPF